MVAPLQRPVRPELLEVSNTKRQSVTMTMRRALAANRRVPLIAWGIYGPLAVGIGIAMQVALLARDHMLDPRSPVISCVAIAAGFLGAKVWFLMFRQGPSRGFRAAGMCVQGGLLCGGLVGITGLASCGLPVG